MSGHSMDKKRMMKPLNNAARERSRVQSLRAAFLDLQRSLPSVPPDTKLSKLDVLVLSTGYIFHLTQTLDRLGHDSNDDNNHVNFLVNSCTNRQHYSVRTSSTTATPTSDVFPSPQMGGINKSQTIDIIPHPESSLYTKLSEVTHDRAKGAEIVMETRRWKEMRPPNFIPSFVQTKTTTAAATARSSLELPDQGHGTFVHPSPREFEWIRTRNRSHVRPKLMTNRTGSVGILHPVKKWPMRYRLYDKILGQQPTLSMTAAAADVCRL